MSQTKLIIDTDPGIDDAMAIVFAALHPEIDLVGLTSVFGNVTVDKTTRNALRLAEFVGQEIPVAMGADVPRAMPFNGESDDVHGSEGFGDIPAEDPTRAPDPRPAAEFICDMITQNPGEIVLCPVGPLTNIAAALDHDPSITSKVKSVVIMGGSLHAGGNVTQHAEANIWNDPHAADIVFAADWPVTMIGLDVTQRINCYQDQFDTLAEEAPRHGGFLNQMFPYYAGFYLKAYGLNGVMMHDPSAVIACIRPELFSYELSPLTVTKDGDAMGETLATTDRPNVTVAVEAEIDSIVALFLDTIRSGG
ncbi:MAG: nucleoside hydrolase [Pseudomonadota bacterium]